MNKTKVLVLSALMAAIICVATIVITIHTPLGYINLGDCFVLLAGWFLSPIYGFCAAAIGSGLADLLSGYALYAPATFVVKGVMALIAFYVFKLIKNKSGDLVSRILSGCTAEIFMILGYFVFEGFIYGFAASAVSIPFNGIQGLVGMTLGIICAKIFKNNNLFAQKK